MTASHISRDPLNQGMLHALVIQIRVVSALVLRETRTRFGHSKIGYAWALLEPIAGIYILLVVYQLFGRHTPVGSSLELFFITGFIPYQFYDRTATRLSGAITANKALLNLPIVKNVDVIFGRAILELATNLVVLLILLGGMWASGVEEAIPRDPFLLAQAILMCWLLGIGVGAVNAVLNALIKSWDNVFRLITRPLYLLSGIFFMPEKLPSPFNEWFLWNPVLHGIEWFRSGFYEGYGKYSLDRGYLLTWVLVSLLIGFALERKMRIKLFVGG